MYGPPQSAEDYLRQVRWEAKTVADVVVAEDREKRQRESEADPMLEAAVTELPTEILPAPAFAMPSPEWERSFLTEFKNVQEELSEFREKIALHGSEGHPTSASTPPIPRHTDEQQWYRLCFDKHTKFRPLVSTVATIDQVKTAAIVRFFDSWFADLVDHSAEPIPCTDILHVSKAHGVAFPVTLPSCLFVLCSSSGPPLTPTTASCGRSCSNRQVCARSGSLHYSLLWKCEQAPSNIVSLAFHLEILRDRSTTSSPSPSSDLNQSWAFDPSFSSSPLSSACRPLDRDTAGAVRSLLRRFAAARAALQSEIGERDVAVLNVFITILGAYFGQYG